MAFLVKKDWFELTDEGGELDGVAVCVSSERGGVQGGVAVGKNSIGDAVCADAFRHSNTFSCGYKLKASATGVTIRVGGVHTFDTSKKLMLTGFSIGTSNNAPTTFSVSGTQVEDSATDHENAKDVEIVSLNLRHHAQDVFAALVANTTRANPKVYMQSMSATGTCDSSTGTITDPSNPLDAGIVSSGMGDVRVECSFTFMGDGTANGSALKIVPSDYSGTDYDYKLASGWIFTAPVGSSNPEEDHPTFTFGVVKHYFAS